MSMWGKYVPVYQRKIQAKKQMDKLKKSGALIEPIEIQGRAIAKEFWGKKWCDHIENYADYENRLPRGRTYVRNGSICHLGIEEGLIDAIVSGSSLYNVSVRIKTLATEKWDAIKKRCGGMVGSILELLQGKISKNVMEVVIDAHQGLFPLHNEISYDCSCPDSAGMCKHVAAVLYGIGNRLDQQPELLFRLRGVNPQELVSLSMNLDHSENENQLQSGNLADLFGIELEVAPPHNETPIIPSTKPKKSEGVKKQKIAFDIQAITGGTIKTLRIKAGLSVANFANVLGVTPVSVYRWEKTSGSLKLHKSPKKALARLAKTL